MLQPHITTMLYHKKYCCSFHSYSFTDLAMLKLDICAPFHHTTIYKGLNSICQIPPLFCQVTSTLEYYLLIFVLEAFSFTENGVCAHQCGICNMICKRI